MRSPVPDTVTGPGYAFSDAAATTPQRRERAAPADRPPAEFDARRERMAIQMPRVGVTADLRVRVPRNDQGTLVDGARTVLERVDTVVAVDDLGVTSVRPDLNTVHTDVRVDLTLVADGELDAEPDADHVAEALREGFGVQRVDVHDVGPPH